MLLHELVLASVFYGVSLLFTFVGLPFTVRIFSDTTLAYITARFTGLLLFGYLVWLLASAHILDYQSLWVLVLFLLALVLSCFSLRKHFTNIKFAHLSLRAPLWGRGNLNSPFNSEIAASQTPPTSLLLRSNYGGQARLRRTGRNDTKRPSWSWKNIFGLELLGLLVYLIYLYLRSHNAEINGTERFMDMALLSASGKTNYFPFVDPWYAGKPVNYYYFGAYLMSLLSNLARLPYALTYNFSIGLIYAQATVLAGGLIYTISKSKVFAFLGSVFLTSAGTVFFANCVLQNWLKNIPTCSYASSTRLFSPSYIINEIPSYSFTVGDLHAHLLALPVFLLGLSFLYALWLSEKRQFSLLFVLIVLLGSMGLINPWDLITLTCLLLLAIFFKSLWLMRAGLWSLSRDWLVGLLLVMVCTFGLMWPGTRSFQNPVMGLGFAPSFVKVHKLIGSQWPTPLIAEVGMWGVFILCVVYFVSKHTVWRKMEGKFLLLLAILSLGIIVGVELFFVRDIYSVANPMYFRANTTFKFGYHAWTMLTIATFAGLGMVVSDYKKQARWIVWVLVGILLVSGAVYPVEAIRQFYLGGTSKLTLDGSMWMEVTSPGDLATIGYINENISKRTVIAEAVGDSYTTFSRISTYTGQITPMGWQTHEWTWRFHPVMPGAVNGETGWTAVSLVAGDIKALYETESISTAKQIIAKYGIKYVYVGMLERNKYAGLNEAKFSRLGHVVFSAGESLLYEIDGK